MRTIAGKPLVEWSLDAALGSAKISKIVVSTDWEEVADLSKNLGIDTPWLRPKELADDAASTVDVVLHALEREKAAGFEYDLVTVLEPTAPLRKPGDLDTIVETLAGRWESLDAIVTACPANFHPSALRRKKGTLWEPYIKGLGFVERRQDGDQAYLPIGHCFAIKPETLAAERTFYAERSTLFEISEFQGVELDTELDFLIIELLLERYRIKIAGSDAVNNSPTSIHQERIGK